MPASIILVKPQMGENIGAAARVMLNFGFDNLRIVQPRDGWPNDKAIEMSAGARAVIHNARIFESLADATEDLEFIYATTARLRDMDKEVVSLNDIDELRANCGIVFGGEKSGLENADIALADKIITIPVGDIYQSLNLAMSVGIVCYEFAKKPEAGAGRRELASKKEMNSLFEHLEDELGKASFFKEEKKQPGMMINIRNMLTRAEFSQQEVRTLRGIIRSLATDGSSAD